jgi:hypothetical protein
MTLLECVDLSRREGPRVEGKGLMRALGRGEARTSTRGVRRVTSDEGEEEEEAMMVRENTQSETSHKGHQEEARAREETREKVPGSRERDPEQSTLPPLARCGKKFELERAGESTGGRGTLGRSSNCQRAMKNTLMTQKTKR